MIAVRWRAAAASVVVAALAATARADGIVPEGDAPQTPAPRAQPRAPAKSKPKPVPRAAPVEPAPAPEPPRLEAEVPPPEPKRQLAQDEIVTLLGRKVVGANNEELGRVVNVLVDGTGRARAAVIDFGGFLGVGSRKIAVDWGQLVFKPGAPDRHIGLTLTREQIQGAAEFRENAPKPVDVVVPQDAPAAPKPEQRPSEPAAGGKRAQ